MWGIVTRRPRLDFILFFINVLFQTQTASLVASCDKRIRRIYTSDSDKVIRSVAYFENTIYHTINTLSNF